MTTDERQVQDHSSAFYEQRYSGYGLDYHKIILAWLMQHAHGKILDAGCGTGLVSRLYRYLDITGIDLSPGMLKHHHGKHKLMSVTDMTFKDESFDFVLCRSLLHHLPNHRDALQEMYRVLQPGGQLALWETNQGRLAQWVRSKTQHGDRFTDYHHAFKAQELVADVSEWFTVDAVQHQGFLAYPIWGFPDILNVARWIPGKRWVFPATMVLDRWLSHVPVVKSMSWALGVKAHKT